MVKPGFPKPLGKDVNNCLTLQVRVSHVDGGTCVEVPSPMT
jgi:hypothetical protein